MALFTDISEIKTILGIDPLDTQEDVQLGFYNEWATGIISEYLNRPDFSLKPRTEFYKGTGTQKLPLRYRPVLAGPTPPAAVYDPQGYFGSTPGAFGASGANAGTSRGLVYGTDFCLQIDQPDGVSSRCGILLRINDYWLRPQVREVGYLSPYLGDDNGSYQVTYQGGWTVDTLPANFRAAANLLVQRLRYVCPLGMELGSESYEGRGMSAVQSRKDYLLSLVKPLLFQFRNWKW